MVNIMIVDDEMLIRAALKKTIEAISSEYCIIGEADSGKSTLEKVALLLPDIIILDIKMPDISGLEIADMLKRKYPQICIILLSGHAEFTLAQAALRIGVFDYILKPIKRQYLDDVLKNACTYLHKTSVNELSNLFKPEYDLITVNSAIAESYQLSLPERFRCSAMICKAILHINENYKSNVNLKDLSDQLFVSPTYLSFEFKKNTGISFSDYLVITRLEHAKQLLMQYSHLKIYEVAEMVGYSTAKYFNRVFKEYVRKTPNEFRDSSSNNNQG